MPHKHRNKRERDEDAYDLPPNKIARPLPVGKSQTVFTSTTKKQRKASQKEYKNDDTPKAFLRLMQFQKTGKGLNGLDDGNRVRGKKGKRTEPVPVESASITNEPVGPTLKIQPGERLADFNARVDQALPVSGLVGKRKVVDGIKERMTKHEKKLRKLQAGWREDEARIREREAEERELAEEQEEEQAALYGDLHPEAPKTRKRSRQPHKQHSDDDDPWEQLRATREAPKGLHDVAQAPPQFKRLPKEKFKVYDGAKADVADIPNASGSLRKREELGQTRKAIIDSYRRLMEEKRKT